jgi:hypothetical protein
MKTSVEITDENGSVFLYIKREFPRISEAERRDGMFVR